VNYFHTINCLLLCVSLHFDNYSINEYDDGNDDDAVINIIKAFEIFIP